MSVVQAWIFWHCPKCQHPNADEQDSVDGPFISVICSDCGSVFDQDAVPGLFRTRPTFYECGCCGAHHSAWWDGDCREDAARFDPEDLYKRYGPNGWCEIEMQDVDDFRVVVRASAS